MKEINLSIVITVYGETFSVRETIERLLKNERGYIKEIIIVISPKSGKESFRISEEIVKKYPNKLFLHIQKNNPGAGWAYREGMQMAKGDYVTLMSGDLETEPEAVDRMVRVIEETGCDCVTTSRWLPGGGFENYDKKKLILNWIFQKTFKILFRTHLTDITYGFKTLKKNVINSIKWEGVLHEIFIETTVKPLRKNFYIEEIPTVWIGRREGVSKNSFIKNFRYILLALKVLFIKPENI